MANLNLRIVIAIIIICFILFYPNGQPDFTNDGSAIADIFANERESLLSLNQFGPSDFIPQEAKWLNLTGLRQEDGYAWQLLAHVKKAARSDVERLGGSKGLDILDGVSEDVLPLYQNVTSWLKGEWVPLALPEGFQAPLINLSSIAPKTTYNIGEWERNITGNGGKLQLRLEEEENKEHIEGTLSYISAFLTIQDERSSGDGWDAILHGIHHRASGNMMLTTTSEKFTGIFALPYFMTAQPAFESAKILLNKTLTKDIEAQVADPLHASPNPWRSRFTPENEEFTKKACELIVYLQQQPEPFDEDQEGLQLIETELRAPSGIPTRSAPEMKLSLVAFSPDCGFILGSKGPPNYPPQDAQHLRGYKLETYISMARTITFGFIVVLGLQVVLLVRELKSVSTPSMQARTSYYTVAMLSMGSAFTWVAFLTTAFFSDSFYLPMLTVAFFAFMEGSFFGMKFLMEIWSVQNTESIARDSQGQRLARTIVPQAEAPVAAISSSPDTLPLPVTAHRPADIGASVLAVPIISVTPPATGTAQEGQEPRRRSFGVLYTQYYMLLLFVVFLSINAATSWPPRWRSAYTNFVSLVYLSFWVPQIYRNIIRNSRRAFSWQFILGQSVLRLVPFVYLWGVDSNVMFVDTDPRMLVVFLAWIWIQILALIGQELLGPRFFVRDNWQWVPAAWNYHPVLREDAEGATLPLGLGPASPIIDTEEVETNETQRLATEDFHEFECAICMQKARVLIAAGDGENKPESFSSAFDKEILGRRHYMVTPCRHIFHAHCLESWMKYRLACPICRSHLPQ